jgi:hypothetical protein
MDYFATQQKKFIDNWFDLSFNDKLHAMHYYVLFPNEYASKNVIDFSAMIAELLIEKTEGMTDDQINDFFDWRKK